MENLGQLREIREDEVDIMLTWRNDLKVRSNMYTRHEITPEEHREWWRRTTERNDRAYYMYEGAGTPMGIVGFSEIDRNNANCSWAFYAAPDAVRGTGSRMEYLALEHAFGQMQLHKLHCEVLAFNAPVVALHQKFGFQIEGRFREHHNWDGEYIDIFRLGLLASEWADKREEMLDKLSRRPKLK